MKNKFNFFVPLEIEKGGEDGKLVKISGVASTDAQDSDEETLIPAGFDFGPLLKSGFFNWNHQARTTSKAICGEPTAAKIIDNGKGFFIEGVLYPNEEGRNVVELAETLMKHSPNRRLGFSIEGQALERDILNPKRVTRARITGVAITQSPKNPNTLMNIIKGEYSEEVVEDLDIQTATTTILEQFNIIVSQLFNTQNQLEHCHRKTKSEPIHEALGESYSQFADLKDSTIELLTGLIGEQYQNILLTSIMGYDPSMNDIVAEQVCIVANQIQQFATENNFSSVESLAQEIHAVGAKLKYKLSLKEGSEELHLDKAMMVDADLNPPSIDGVKQTTALSLGIKKSDIYNQIHSRFKVGFEKATQIYEFINKVKQKSMDANQEITQDVLTKAFDLLEQSLIKGEDSEQKTAKDYDKKDEVIDNSEEAKKDDDGNDDDGDDDDDDDFEKAINAEEIAKSLLDKGMDTDEVVKAMTSVGVSLTLAETACSNCIAQANAEKDGGNITTLKKSEDDDLGDQSQETLKAISKGIDKRFVAVSQIMKASAEKISSLEKSNGELMQSLKKYISQPEGRKSVGSQRAVERFEKSNDGKGTDVYDSNNAADMRSLSTRLFGEVELIKSQGHEDRGLERAVADLEIAKTTNFTAIGPRLRAMGIEVR